MFRWEEVREELNLTPEDEVQIAFEKELIETIKYLSKSKVKIFLHKS